jgi:hypothetical protein
MPVEWFDHVFEQRFGVLLASSDASGLRSHVAENSCDSIPMATLERAMKLASAINEVGSSRPAGPSGLSNLPDSSSVTVGGVRGHGLGILHNVAL